jgi:hypothetical protein
MRVLPEEVRVRRALGEGIGRGLRDIYAEQKAEPLPDHVRGLLLRVEQAPSPLRSAVPKGQHGAEEPRRQAIWSAAGEAA